MNLHRAFSFLLIPALFLSSNLFAHGLTDQDARDLAGAYGYVYSQKMCVEHIKEKFPTLRYDVIHFQNAWEAKYPKAKSSLLKHLQCFGLDEEDVRKAAIQYGDWNNIKQSLLKELRSENEVQAKNHIANFLYRLDHPSEYDRKIFSIIGDVVYYDRPELEFSKDRVKYSTYGHPKAQGLDIQIEMPASWRGKEATRPHIVQKWEKNDEENYQAVMILVADNPENTDWTEDDFREMVRTGEAWDLFPSKNQMISREEPLITRIEGIPALIISGISNYERVGIKSKVYCSNLAFTFKGKFISVQFLIYSQDLSKLEQLVNKNKMLKMRIFNSIYLSQLWK